MRWSDILISHRLGRVLGHFLRSDTPREHFALDQDNTLSLKTDCQGGDPFVWVWDTALYTSTRFGTI